MKTTKLMKLLPGMLMIVSVLSAPAMAQVSKEELASVSVSDELQSFFATF